MEEKTLNSLREQRKYSIILTILLVTTGALLWRAKWTLLAYTKLVLLTSFLFQMELLLIGSTLTILITALSILMINKKSYSPQTPMKLVKTFNKNLYVALARKYAGWQISVFIKMLMIFLLLMVETLFLMLYTIPQLSLLKM